jgi:hypothetical protein
MHMFATFNLFCPIRFRQAGTYTLGIHTKIWLRLKPIHYSVSVAPLTSCLCQASEGSQAIPSFTFLKRIRYTLLHQTLFCDVIALFFFIGFSGFVVEMVPLFFEGDPLCLLTRGFVYIYVQKRVRFNIYELPFSRPCHFSLRDVWSATKSLND